METDLYHLRYYLPSLTSRDRPLDLIASLFVRAPAAEFLISSRGGALPLVESIKMNETGKGKHAVGSISLR